MFLKTKKNTSCHEDLHSISEEPIHIPHRHWFVIPCRMPIMRTMLMRFHKRHDVQARKTCKYHFLLYVFLDLVYHASHSESDCKKEENVQTAWVRTANTFTCTMSITSKPCVFSLRNSANEKKNHSEKLQDVLLNAERMWIDWWGYKDMI